MKSRIICILLFNLIILFVSAGTRKLNFQVYDELTQLGIRPFVEVYNATDTSRILKSFSSLKIGEFTLNIDENLPKIIIKIYGTREEVKNNGIWHLKSSYYTPKCIELELNSDLPNPYNHPAVYLERYRQKDLKEVTVTASKVMFYHKGDTLIYNADAFVTPQGSTLDALIKQLPGVEIDNSGTITCDGRRIDMLMLNGRDFFDGNSKILLNNLDAFTVKDIAVYEKLGHTSELMQRKTGDEKRVMDVRLKRQYHIGMMTNNDIGYGTHDRYLANIFGVGFSDYLSVSAFANLPRLAVVPLLLILSITGFFPKPPVSMESLPISHPLLLYAVQPQTFYLTAFQLSFQPLFQLFYRRRTDDAPLNCPWVRKGIFLLVLCLITVKDRKGIPAASVRRYPVRPADCVKPVTHIDDCGRSCPLYQRNFFGRLKEDICAFESYGFFG